MSGIFGIYHFDGEPVSQEDIESMMAPLARNGPDGSRTWVRGPYALGCTKLQTTPESLYEQLPELDPETGLVLTADVRIDNREELLDALGIRLGEARTIPDSSLILRAYMKWGEDCPHHLLGAFAFAICDTGKNSFFCARDQIGFKPFYYYHSRSSFLFATEVRSILQLAAVPRKVNETTLASYLVQRHDDRESTFYEEIRRLPPAHTLTVSQGQLRKNRYWKLEPGPRLKLASDGEYAEALRAHILTAVKSHLRSSHPTGVMLSGGLDSASVAGIAARELGEQGQHLTAVCSALPENHAGAEVDERTFMEAIRAQEHNIDLVHVLAAGVTPFDTLDDSFQLMHRPPFDPFAYMTAALLRAAHEQGVRPLLNGAGGDSAASFAGAGSLRQLFVQCAELVLGRSKDQSLERLSAWHLLRHELLNPLSPDLLVRLYLRTKGKEPLSWLSSYAIRPEFAARMHLDLPPRHRLLPKVRDQIVGYIHSGPLQEILEEWACRSAAVGIELRYPLLDKRLIEFCARVPADQHVRDGFRRSLMRRAMQGIVPHEVLWRTTKGPFAPDYHRRMAADGEKIVAFLHETDGAGRAWEYVSKSKMKRALERLKPWEGGARWETDTQRVLGRGLHVARFVKWIDSNGIAL